MTLYKWSQTSASDATADSTINWQEGQAPSTVNDSARAMMAANAKYRDDIAGAIVTGGTSTAYTAASYQVFDTLAHMNGQVIAFSPHVTNAATVTLNVDSLGAKPLRLSPGVELPANTLILGACYTALYNNSNAEFYLRDHSATVIGANQVVIASIADANVTYAKIQNVAASRLLGNPTGSGAAPAEISLGAGLSFSGTSIVSTLDATLVPSYLSGLTLSTAGSSATFGIAAGGANDTASGGMMILSSAYTKTTSAWAVGSGNGGLDTSTIAINTWYHVFLIKRIDTGVVDVLFSTSPTSPAMPSGYTLSRRIGSMKTDGSSQWIKFFQVADRFIWAAPVLDANGSASVTSRSNVTLSVPTGIVVNALFRAGVLNGNNIYFIYTSLLENDQTPAVQSADLIVITGAGGTGQGQGNFARLTDTSARIGRRATNTGASEYISTYGWEDSRGK